MVLVFLQSRKASEQAKSVDSKTDSIGSGRAIPIKQVSTFTYFYPHISLVSISIFSSEVIFFLNRTCRKSVPITIWVIRVLCAVVTARWRHDTTNMLNQSPEEDETGFTHDQKGLKNQISLFVYLKSDKTLFNFKL